MVTKTVDAKGRLALGPDWAGSLAIVRDLGRGVIEVTRAEAIPASEAWLFKNPEALAAVRQGLAEAQSGQFVEGPDLNAGRSLAEAIGDD